MKGRRIWQNVCKGILVSLCACSLIFFAGTSSLAQQVVKIGNIIPLSGPSASVGQQGKQAREMAVEEIKWA